ncbi:MAG: hypothetical protein WAS33_11410, partial [Candidatus Promineifilaceae bacterium]
MRRFTITILLLICLIACRDAPAPDAPDTPDAPPTVLATDQAMITLAVESGSQSRYQPLIDEFEAQYTSIDVQLIIIDDAVDVEGSESYIRQLVTQADVIPTAGQHERDTHLLLDLHPLLIARPDIDVDDFYPN